MLTIGKTLWKRLVPALATALLLAAPPALADHQTFPVTVTLTGTVLENGHMRLVATRTAYVANGGPEILRTGCQYRERADGETFSDSDSDWIEISAPDGTCSVTVEDMMGSPPYTFQARFWATFETTADHVAYSPPSAEVTLDPTESTEQ